MAKDIFPSPQHRNLLLTTLKTLGVTHVEVSFSGGGDSGSIDDVSFMNGATNLEGAKSTMLVWTSERQMFDTEASAWKRVVETQSMTLEDIVKNITDDMLNYTGLDWYNNEGGSGSMSIDLNTNPPEITLNVGINVREDHHFNFSGTGEKE